MKTLSAWQGSGLTLDQYLSPGDRVSPDFFDYFLELLPPAFNQAGIVAMGEPVGWLGDEQAYACFRLTSTGCQYLGNQTLSALNRFICWGSTVSQVG